MALAWHLRRNSHMVLMGQINLIALSLAVVFAHGGWRFSTAGLSLQNRHGRGYAN